MVSVDIKEGLAQTTREREAPVAKKADPPPKKAEVPPIQVTAPAPAAPAAQQGVEPAIFDIQLSKDGPLGITLDIKVTGLCVVRIGGGCFDNYNNKVDQSRRVRRHDFIIAINGKTDRDAMLNEVKECTGMVNLKIARPMVFPAKLKKGSRPLGAGLGYQEESCSVDVREIRDGVLKEYNDGQHEDKFKVRVDDCIIGVNNIFDDPAQMIEAMKSLDEFELKVMRPPTPVF